MTQSQPDVSIVKSNLDSIPGTHRFSYEAMATTFEVIIRSSRARYAKQAAWAAFDELTRLEGELSRFIENSDISRLNNLAANQPLQIGLAAFECLQQSLRMYVETNGAFDITIGSLRDCWLNDDKTMRTPSQAELALARQRSGSHLIKLNEAEHTAQLLAGQVQIDLGGIGKGYAVDRMAELLRDWDIDTALIHAGGSSVLAIGAPAGTAGWPLTLSSPDNHERILARLHLKDRAVSGSGLQKGRHIIDPRTAQPAGAISAAWSCASDAATADALSTAFMIMSADEIEQYCLSHPGTLAMVVMRQEGGDGHKDRVLRFGHWKPILSF